MRRREFVILLAVAGASLPLAARAQQARTPVIGFLSSVSLDKYTIRLEAFRQGLKEVGYVEGQNVAVNIAGRKDKTSDLLHLEQN